MRQSEALAILGSGASVFLTGAPGAGKTYVLNEFIRQARADGASVAVTASTGIAATHINGTTIHSWSGIGLATALTDNLVKTVRTRRKRKLQEADILIIDEVSMLHAWLFDMVDRICRIIRRDERPFGGLQVVLSDYCARWNQGLKGAIHGQEHIADSLDVAVAGYLAQDEQAAATFRDIHRDLSPL